MGYGRCGRPDVSLEKFDRRLSNLPRTPHEGSLFTGSFVHLGENFLEVSQKLIALVVDSISALDKVIHVSCRDDPS